jgi:hypothetical protein
MLQKIKLALGDYKTTIPALLLGFFGILQATGGIALPMGIQNAITYILVSVVAFFSGGIMDLKTTAIGVIVAVLAILEFFGLVIPPQILTGIVTFTGLIFGLLTPGAPTPAQTSLPLDQPDGVQPA